MIMLLPNRAPHRPISDAERRAQEELLRKTETNDDKPSDDRAYQQRVGIREANRDGLAQAWEPDAGTSTSAPASK